jgi:hypothetical protein
MPQSRPRYDGLKDRMDTLLAHHIWATDLAGKLPSALIVAAGLMTPAAPPAGGRKILPSALIVAAGEATDG